MKMRSLVFVAVMLSAVGCMNGEDATTSSLGTGLKPEGFLVIKDITDDPAKPGSFLVSCASSSGVKQASYTKSEIETNKVCLPAAASAPASQPAQSGSTTQVASTAPSSSGTGYKAVNNQSTYIKARAGLDVTANIAVLDQGVDYCVVSEVLSASLICKASEKELKATGVKIPGCDLTSGYVFASHFSVTPAVSACR